MKDETKKEKRSISIVGFGRFGKVWYRLLRDDFEITLFDKKGIDKGYELTQKTTVAKTVSDIYKNEVIFYAVPIESFEEVIKSHRKHFNDNHLLVDLLSVKMHPAKVFSRYLKNSDTQAMLIHPMFGPDSSKDGFNGLTIVMDRFRTNRENYNYWRSYFSNKSLNVVEMSAREHDLLASKSQGLTHFVGRLLDLCDFKSTPIDTAGTKILLKIKEQTCNDTWQLFTNLQQYNPYTKKMRLNLGDKYDRLYNKLLPKQATPKKVTIGIQGGRGSFNEEAIQYYLNKTNTEKYLVRYLYTSDAVLKALHEGLIDQGQFAIHNSVGGIVKESIQAMSKYKFRIIEEYGIRIAHALMIHIEAKLEEIDTIMSHPQVFAQCKRTLSVKYSNLKKISGKGKLVDHAHAAKHLSEGRLSKNTAIMGSKVLARIYGLKIIEDDLQDARDNITSFLLVERN